jgi:hypothetical protein
MAWELMVHAELPTLQDGCMLNFSPLQKVFGAFRDRASPSEGDVYGQVP